MANLTITVDEELLRRARIRALEQGTSVNALLREYLSAFAGDHPAPGGSGPSSSGPGRPRRAAGAGHGRGTTSTTVRPFVDTNVFVYAHDADEPAKRERALELLAEHAASLVVSTQVLAEFYVVTTRKLAKPLEPEVAAAQLDDLSRGTVVGMDSDLVRSAVSLSREHGLSLWDAMIVRAAVRGGCDVLFSEDMTDGATLDGVRVSNPFT
jgi:predicted nucleic acid-binding protein